MRRGIVWLGLVVGPAGCDKVFTFQENPDGRPADAPAVCFTPGPATADDDGDGQLNKDDVCPRVANQTVFNEDGDAVVDSCDPCPEFADAGDDADCDDIGAACDPEPMAANKRDFYGMNDDGGFVSNDDVFIESGEARMSAVNGNLSGSFLIAGGSLPAYFDASARIEDPLINVYWVYSLQIVTATDVHRVDIRHSGDQSMRFVIEREPPLKTILDSILLPSLATNDPVTIKLRVQVTATRIKAIANVNGVTHEVEVDNNEIQDLSPPTSYQHGLAFYRDPFSDPRTMNSYTQYYAITRPKP